MQNSIVKSKTPFSALVFTFFLYAFAFSIAQASVMDEVNRYTDSLAKLEAGKRGQFLHDVYGQGKAVASKLMETLESLSENDFQALKKNMKGFRMNREEVVFVEPDVDFFKKLAKKHGRAADIAFFDLLKKYKPHSVWPVYMHQQTDVGGCTKYGTGILASLYGKASKFLKKFKTAYEDDIREMMEELENQFTGWSCACGDADSVMKELKLFLAQFPKSKISPAVKKRLAGLKAGKSSFEFHCIGGQ